MRWLIRTLFALMLVALLWTPAAACQLMSAQVRVACPDEAVVVAYQLNDEDEDVLRLLSPACAAALGPAVRQLIAERQARVKASDTETLFSVTPWTQADEDRLRAAQERDLLTCRYQRWQRTGDWLVSEDAVRSYCDATSGGRPGRCGGVALSWSRFLVFAFRHPGWQTWPYILGVVLGVLGVGFWLIHRIRSGQRADLLIRNRWFSLLVSTSSSICWSVRDTGCALASRVHTTVPYR
jgi:hypothetical protein